MSFWLFSSKNVENIEVAKNRLLWGFWHKDAGEKFKKNWREFIKLYNRIKPFDIVVFQVAKNYNIHAIGVVKDKYFDDQTLIWPNEIERGKVLYPWRVSFICIIFSKTPFTTHSIKIENYVDGYGIGKLDEHEFRKILNEIQNKPNIEINLSHEDKY